MLSQEGCLSLAALWLYGGTTGLVNTWIRIDTIAFMVSLGVDMIRMTFGLSLDCRQICISPGLESCNLRKLGVQVAVLAVNSDSEHSQKNGIPIAARGRNHGRLGRFVLNPMEAVRYCKCHTLDYDVLHVHDPQMLPWIGRLKRVTKRPII